MRNLGLLIGVVFILTGIFLPHGWYDALPRSEADLPWVWQDASTELTRNLPLPPVKGVTLLQISLMIEGLVLIWLAQTGWSFKPLNTEERLSYLNPDNTSQEPKKDIRHTSYLILTAIILLGLLLRIFRLDSDLWLDEIAPLLFYGQMPFYQVITTYVAANNHLLNTLLMKMCIGIFGESEWSVRLPAVFFGVAAIPALYYAARLVLSERASLGAALLLAVSYHHIFFSQNARGYSAYLFFSIVSSALLVKGLSEDKLGIWILYIAAMLLNIVSLLNSGFVLAAHILVGFAALWIIKRKGGSIIPQARRLSVVFGVITFLAFQVYSTTLPQIYVYSKTVYTDPATGYGLFSAELWQELLRGLSAGLSSGIIFALFPVIAIGGYGFLILFRRNALFITALSLPLVFTALFLIFQGLTFSPRFFLLALPVAFLSAAAGLESISRALVKSFSEVTNIRLSVILTIFLAAGCGLSLFSLKYYYSIPKQSYRASLAYIKSKQRPNEKIVVIHLAEKGYRYYAPRFGFKEGIDFFSARSVKTYDDVLSSQSGRAAFLVTTFPRALHISHPELEARIMSDWKKVEVFPGTIGDGEITLWERALTTE